MIIFGDQRVIDFAKNIDIRIESMFHMKIEECIMRKL